MSDIDCVYTQSGDQFATQMWCDERDCWKSQHLCDLIINTCVVEKMLWRAANLSLFNEMITILLTLKNVPMSSDLFSIKIYNM